MLLTTLYARFFRSFNFDYLRQNNDTAARLPWDTLDEATYYPFVSIDLERDVTTVVGANESGKSQLITAIQCLLGTAPINPRDFCRYSPFFGVRGRMPVPEFGGYFTQLNAEERSALQNITSDVSDGAFWLFRLTGGARLYVQRGSAVTYFDVSAVQVESLRLPKPRRIEASVVLPSSVSLYDLVQNVSSPDLRDRSAWAAVHRDLKLQEATYAQPTATSQLLPPMPARLTYDENRAQSSLALVRQLFERVGGVDPRAFEELLYAEAADDGYASAIVASMSAALATTLNFPKWWSQDRDFALEVHKEGFHLVLTMRDRTGQTYTFSERSGGMQHFLSYFIQYQAYGPVEPGRSEILLMDEPDAFLSTQGQQDLLRVFQSYAHPETAGREAAQVLYVTHSPFLIDKNRPERIRVLEKGYGEEGTRVVAKVNVEQYEPLRSAFGSFHADTAFIGNCNLLVEGPADQILFSGLSAAITKTPTKRSALDLNTLTLVPVHGATQYRYSLHLTRGKDLDRPAVIVLMDSDREGRAARVDLEHGFGDRDIIDPNLIFAVGDLALDSLSIDVDVVEEPEDLVPADVARRAALQIARDYLSADDVKEIENKLPDPLPIDGASRLFDQVQKAVKAGSKTIQRPLVIGKKEFARAVSKLAQDDAVDPPEATVRLYNNFALLFERINEMQLLADRESTEERVTQVIKRLVERFKRDHRSQSTRFAFGNFLAEVESHLEGTTPEEEGIRQVIRELRAEAKVSEAPLEDVEEFMRLRNRLGDLIWGVRRLS